MPTEIRFTLVGGEQITVYPDRLFINGKMITEEDMRFVLGKCCYGNGHEKLLADFYHCIKTGQHFTLDGTEASKVLKIIFAVYKNSGERESIEES